LVRGDGANKVVVGELGEGAGQFGPYDLIIDTVGGNTLASLLSHLGPEGVCVTMGYSSSPSSSIDVRWPDEFIWNVFVGRNEALFST